MSMLERLDDSCVMSITYGANDTFIIMEECDNCYRAILTKEELIQLGNEIIALANGINIYETT